MNIFILESVGVSVDWKKSAEALDNKRINKMVLESLQMLSTAAQLILQRKIDGLYKITHKNHPCSIWARESYANFRNLLLYTYYAMNEYKRRYRKEHSGIHVWLTLSNLLLCGELEFFKEDGTMPPLAVSKEFRVEVNSVHELVAAYRAFYLSKPTMYYNAEDIPEWFAKERVEMNVKINNKYYEITGSSSSGVASRPARRER